MIKLTTNYGTITLELDTVNAPKTSANFIAYVESGHYDGTIFHRVIKNFMIQGGGMTPDMEQKPTQAPIENEGEQTAKAGLKNVRGSIAMARTNDPHSATAQFFINTVDNDFLDFKAPSGQGWGYCVFGKVVDGMDVVDAIRALPTGNKGFHQDVPKDVQNQLVEVGQLPPPAVPDAGPQLDLDAVEAAVRMINEAQRPVLYLGGGVVHSGASALALDLAEQGNLPTTMTLMALGAMPMDHPLSIGMLGMHGARYTNLVLEEADLLICVGARFDDRAIGRTAQFCTNAKIIHIDIDRSELHKIKNAHVAINADVTAALEALLPRVRATLRTDWLAQVAELKQRFPMQFPDVDDPRSHYGLIKAVADALDDEAVIATDVGQHQMWVAQAYPFRRPRQWLTSGGLGTMGFGFPAAIGAALAEPERTVVCFSGDGSFKMNIQELATLAEEGLNVKIVLMNNNALGLVYQQQTLFYGQRLFASKYRTEPDFVKIAEGFGVAAVDLDCADNPRAALAEALHRPGPCLIHATIDREQFVYPMVPPGAANTEMIGG